MDEQEIEEYNNSGNYDYINRKGKKKRIAYYDGDDVDGDSLSDTAERAIGLHDSQNRHIKHFNIGGNLRANNDGFLLLEHQHLTSYKPRKNKNGKFSLTMPTPRKMPLSLDMKNPLVKLTMKEIKIPKASFDDKRIKTNTGSFEMKHLEAFLKKVSEKKKKKGLFQW